MKDADKIKTLADACGGYDELAAALNVTRQTLWNWRTKGISQLGHYQIADAAKKNPKLRVP